MSTCRVVPADRRPWPTRFDGHRRRRSGSDVRSIPARSGSTGIYATLGLDDRRQAAIERSGRGQTSATPRRWSGSPIGDSAGRAIASRWRPLDSYGLGLTGARALVGGGSGGLGGAIAAVLRAEGATVGLAARPSDRLEAAAARLGCARAARPTCPPGRPGGRGRAAAVEAFGGLDLLVVNSGGPPPGGFDELDEAAWQAAIDGTLWSAIRLLRAALPHLREGRDPAILVILSSSVREPIPGLTTSNLLRPGLAGLIKSLVEEIAPVRINGLAPGRLATDRIAQLDARAVAHDGPARSRRSERRTIDAHPARALRRPARARPAGGVPAVARRLATSPGRSSRSTAG